MFINVLKRDLYIFCGGFTGRCVRIAREDRALNPEPF